MREKEPIVGSPDYGKDEDSAEVRREISVNSVYHLVMQDACSKTRLNFLSLKALLKKHEALMSDLSAYGSSIQGLKEQAQSCRVNSTFYP